MNIDFNTLEQLVLQRLITKRSHPNGQLFIYNYTAKAQYENIWTPETLQARGLIFNSYGNLIARPFPKFFNLDEYQDTLPLEPFEIYEKLDGSLGILYFFEDMPYIATRGSFDSGQASKANEMLYRLYNSAITLLDRNLTYLFEIIHPSHRLVIDYGDTESLTLIAVIDTMSGKEHPIEDFSHLGFPIVKRYDGIKDLYTLQKINQANKEGFVVRFPSGLRLKVKFADYIRIYSILSGLSNKMVWEMIRGEKSFEEILEAVPDELYDWLKNIINSFETQYKEIENSAQTNFNHISSLVIDINNRKELAKHVLTCKYPHILFYMLDGKDYKDYIWQLLKPSSYENPFGKIEDIE